MEKMEIYLLLFTDSLFSNFAINVNEELSFSSMKIFGTYEGYLVIFAAFIGSIIAYSANYFLGKVFYKILAPLHSPLEHEATEKRLENIRALRILPAILALTIIPFWGKFVPLFAGFCKISFTRVMIISVNMKLSYYCLAYYFF